MNVIGTHRELGKWVVTFIDSNGLKQQTIDYSLCRAVSLAHFGRWLKV